MVAQIKKQTAKEKRKGVKMITRNHIYLRKLKQAPRELTYDLNFVTGQFDICRFRKSKDRVSVMFDVEIPLTYDEVYEHMKHSPDAKKNISEQFELKFTKKQLIDLRDAIDYKLKKLKVKEDV